MTQEIINSSFRDPSGYIFNSNGTLLRQVNKSYAENYTQLMHSGLYDALVAEGLLIPHKEVPSDLALNTQTVHKVIQPELIPFISYPFEWSFTMLKDSALATLKILKVALAHNMVLKDATAYNIQFRNAKPVLIDTLSFENYCEGEPWVAFQQFCKHFLAPLALMSYKNIEFGKLSQLYIDGIPLDFASNNLPIKSRLNLGILLHIFLHSRSQIKHASIPAGSLPNKKLSKVALLSIIDNLQTTVEKLRWNIPSTEWGDYYSATNYTDDSMDKKCKQVENLILKTHPKKVWDLGGNTGKFSRLSSSHGIHTVSFDIDPAVVEFNYLECKEKGDKNLLPLILDLVNPTPAIGFSNRERFSMLERGPVDTVLALALIHHMAISNNLPFEKIAQFFVLCGEYLVIEFVPKADSQVKRLLSSRKDIFPKYTYDGFKNAFSKYYDVLEEQRIENTERTLFLMKKKVA